ncbi:methylenetetrahydrofolate reductase [NAD(P)H] [Bifidobacterium thermacidophilum]|uniref:Methylenetetrahydrofolate reductase n=1 Tax=Bifidobacterium thermacidophilum subsp. thermacidophilum TaxID=79262 RepID=A0A087E1A6_9BIFI|nr:methylenetetrahydrofolate reductase [NAD(P)H] [Bifidobacterium thermacidophilum]KFJ01557.1 5,10-methylenetetrahydrofolate reductase [Bifidobacterium thermacidophilum subsp. thermacidophilum]
MHQPMFSIEVFPPKRNAPVGTIYDTLDGLQGLNPDFISVTYGTGKSSDRTATARIANTIRKEYDIPVVAHLTAQYTTREQVDEALDMFKQAGVSAVLALRGDPVPDREPAGAFEHASDLVAYIREHDPDMTIFGACYPECHPQASDLDEDISNLKIKVDAGASHLISQLFYDNADFYHFLDKARAAGIDVPIEAGIMPVTNAKQIRRMVRMCLSRVPLPLEALLDKWGDDPKTLKQAGVIYASNQIADLVAHGVDGVHLYSMNKPAVTRQIWHNVEDLFSPGQTGTDFA